MLLAVLFGSRARGETEPADVDLLLELNPPGDEVVQGIYDRLTARFKLPFDVSTTRSAAHSKRFWTKAIREGQVLADRKRRWPSIKADPEGARRGVWRPVGELASGERRAVVEYFNKLNEEDEIAANVAAQQRLDS